MHDKEFDRIIRERLKDVGSRHQPSGWAYIERRLQAEGSPEPSSGQAEDAFDEVLRQKLQLHTPPPLVPDWSSMEELLDATGAGTPASSPESFDQVLFQKLRNLHMPFRQQHWARMADKLDREFVNAGIVWRSKVIELSLLAFLALTFWQHFDPVPSSGAFTANLRPAGEKQAVQADPASSPQAPISTNPATTSAGRLTGESINPTTAPNASALASARERSEQSPDPGRPRFSAGNVVPPQLPALTHRPSYSGGPAVALAPTLTAAAKEGHAPAPMASLVRLRSLSPEEARSAHSPHLAMPGSIAPVRRRPFMYLGLLGSVDYNRIISPSARFLDVRLQKFDRYELGYSGGLSLGFELGNWEIQTGAVYSYKNYRPLQAEFWDGAFDEGYAKVQLKDIELNIVQLPLLFRYNLLQYDSWRFYVLAGGTVHVAVSANYYYDNIGTPNPKVLEPNRGWFDGGTFRENSYMTANVGVGLERFMSPRWSLFAQPTYHHAINLVNHGMGPSRDRISTMSIYTGVRIRVRR